MIELLRVKTGEAIPRIVAESLVVVDDPAAEALDPGERRAPAAVAAAIARALHPAEAPDQPPPWLLADQVRSFRRVLAATRGFGGALLADPVGSGKSYVSLAAAARLAHDPRFPISDSRFPIDVVPPAVMRDTWQRLAREVGVAIRVTSHERVSRGEGPDGRGPVIVDECHRFRNPVTRRYEVLAPLLVGRPVVLVSATPVVNRLDDLLHQLRLAIADDALRCHGVPSLRAALAAGSAPPALAAIVVSEPRSRDGGLERNVHSIADWLAGDRDAAAALRLIDRLRLSRDQGVAALLRTGFLRALASSPAALRTCARRYALLLEHGAAAREAGRRVSRRDIEREVGALTDQLVMWDLLDDPGAPAELALGDRAVLARLDRCLVRWLSRSDRKVALLRTLLADRRPTLVFTGWVETVRHLQRGLELPGTAWVTGTRAGIGACRYPRRAVLAAFDPRAPADPLPARAAPWLLLATDVAAEGLNLQRVARVVHYDLPWTQVRLDQRDGRALRLGSVHPAVQVVRFEVPLAIEPRLRLADRLAAKGALPGAVGLGAAVSEGWHWRRSLDREWCGAAAESGWAVARAGHAGSLVALRVDGVRGGSTTIALAGDGDGHWSDDPGLLQIRLRAARAAEPGDDEGAAALVKSALGALAPIVRRRLRLANAWAWVTEPPTTIVGAALRAARARLDQARRERCRLEAARAERVLAVLARGLTAGEERLAAAIVRGDGAAWERLAALDATTGEPPVSPRVTVVGLIVFAP